MFFRIFRFRRKQHTAKPSPPCPNCHPKKVSKRPEPLSAVVLHSASAQAPVLALASPPTPPNPILVVSRDSAQAIAHTDPPSYNSEPAHAPPVSPRKKRHVSFAPVFNKAGCLAARSPYQSPCPSPSPSELSAGPASSVSTLVDIPDVDQVPANPITDAVVLGNGLDLRVASGDGNTRAIFGVPEQPDSLSSSTSMCKERTSKARHTCMIPSARPKLSRLSIPASPPSLAIRASISHANRKSVCPSSPTSRRTSKRFSTVSITGAKSAKGKKEKRASRWSQHMNSPETQEVLRALRDMQ